MKLTMKLLDGMWEPFELIRQMGVEIERIRDETRKMNLVSEKRIRDCEVEIGRARMLIQESERGEGK